MAGVVTTKVQQVTSTVGKPTQCRPVDELAQCMWLRRPALSAEPAVSKPWTTSAC